MSTAAKADARPALLAGAVAALLTVVAVYALLRGHDVLFKSEPNPATVIYAGKIAMFWRVAIGSYIAPMVGLGAFALARRDLGRTFRGLQVVMLVVAALITTQALVLP